VFQLSDAALMFVMMRAKVMGYSVAEVSAGWELEWKVLAVLGRDVEWVVKG